MKSTLLVISLSLLSLSAFAWDGTDSETGAAVEIERGTLVRSGRGIDYFDNDLYAMSSARATAAQGL